MSEKINQHLDYDGGFENITNCMMAGTRTRVEEGGTRGRDPCLAMFGSNLASIAVPAWVAYSSYWAGALGNPPQPEERGS